MTDLVRIEPGKLAEQRRAMRSLAMSIREGVHPDAVRDWLVAVWQGRDPLTGEAVGLKDRAAALQMLVDRGWGQAAQHVVVEGQIRNELVMGAPRAARPQLTLEQINERRTALRRLGVQPKMLEASAVEHPSKITDREDAGDST